MHLFVMVSQNFSTSLPRCYGNDDPLVSCPTGELQNPQGRVIHRIDVRICSYLDITLSLIVILNTLLKYFYTSEYLNACSGIDVLRNVIGERDILRSV